ncbi:YbgA family protein [Proteus hauseri]|uniref:YbgA family protein n=1 Tax=Proteus hauseri TaxID=183417 RepID=UPI0032DBD433
MKEKYYYLELSSEIESNNNKLLHEKLHQFCALLHRENIEIEQVKGNETKNILLVRCFEEKNVKLQSVLEQGTLQLTFEQLAQPRALDHFLTQFFALIDYHQQVTLFMSKKALIQFHSRYKYLLMAYSQVAYRELGRYMANIPDTLPLDEFAYHYQTGLMSALAVAPSREGHTNALMHMAGYFKRALNTEQKQQLTQDILRYRQGIVPLSVPCLRMKDCLVIYSDSYLIQQRYFSPYPASFDYLREQL